MTPDTAHHSQPLRIRRQAISENNSGFESQKGLKQNLEINTQVTRCPGSRWGYLKKNSQIELCMVDKGFGGRQYQKTTLASNPKRDYILFDCLTL
jgi:hypothetical protein